TRKARPPGASSRPAARGVDVPLSREGDDPRVTVLVAPPRSRPRAGRAALDAGAAAACARRSRGLDHRGEGRGGPGPLPGDACGSAGHTAGRAAGVAHGRVPAARGPTRAWRRALAAGRTRGGLE